MKFKKYSSFLSKISAWCRRFLPQDFLWNQRLLKFRELLLQIIILMTHKLSYVHPSWSLLPAELLIAHPLSCNVANTDPGPLWPAINRIIKKIYTYIKKKIIVTGAGSMRIALSKFDQRDIWFTPDSHSAYTLTLAGWVVFSNKFKHMVTNCMYVPNRNPINLHGLLL